MKFYIRPEKSSGISYHRRVCYLIFRSFSIDWLWVQRRIGLKAMLRSLGCWFFNDILQHYTPNMSSLYPENAVGCAFHYNVKMYKYGPVLWDLFLGLLVTPQPVDSGVNDYFPVATLCPSVFFL